MTNLTAFADLWLVGKDFERDGRSVIYGILLCAWID
jgi:hypothetical protein